MAIFSRRTLQRLINENAFFLTKRQTKKHVNELNKGDLGAEWEVVLLNVFSKLGKVEHERNFSGKNPDIYFTSLDGVLDFLADVKTVSDEGIETKNPYNQLSERLHNEVEERGIKGHWDIRVEGNYEEASKNGSMVQLKLPALAHFDRDIFNEKFSDFALLVKNNPNEERKYKIKTESIDLAISYQPSEGWTGSGNYPSYKSIERREHLIKNSIYNGLESKSHQLKSSNYEGVLGIIICDGGSEFLKRSLNIVREFFYAHPHINFVLAFEVVQNFRDNPNQVIIYFEKGEDLNAELEDFLSNFHENSEGLFPYPVRSATNANNHLKAPKRRTAGSFIGGCTMSGNKIKLSSRTILDLLAGNITYEEFPEDYKNYFKRRADEGKLIDEIEIEKAPDEKDDDWLTIKFGEPDAAVSPFKIPDINK
jgi:hypothetical protein